jgi:hypothetical protein
MKVEINRYNPSKNYTIRLLETDYISRETVALSLKNQIAEIQKYIDFLKNENEVLQNYLHSQQIIID